MNKDKSNEELINKIVYLMQRDESVDASPDLVKWAKNLFRTRIAEPKKSVIERVFAVLQMDLSPGKAAFGERSASAAQVRQMFFDAGENGVDLRISESEKGFDINGQILGGDFANCTVKLGETETRAGELGEFKFTKIKPGKYDLIFRSGEREIFIQGLDLV